MHVFAVYTSMDLQLTTQAKMRMGFVCALLALLGIGFISEDRLQHWIDDAAWVSHTQDELATLVSLSASLRTVESEERVTCSPGIRKRKEVSRSPLKKPESGSQLSKPSHGCTG